jgi:hypothetical protein
VLQYIHLGDFAFDVRIARTASGTYLAQCPDWEEEAEGETVCEALQTLTRYVSHHVRRGVEREAKERKRLHS